MLLMAGCASAPVKKNFLMNYGPGQMESKLKQGPYPFVIRLKQLDIEEAYARPQIVYRTSPFELQYYFYKVWAVKPARMITDLVYKHLNSAGIVSSIVRRFDEGSKPDFELSGIVEAIEEYDSEDLWFAHIALRLQLRRLVDGRVIYSRRFDQRKRVYQNQPEFVVRVMSEIMDHIMTQTMHDLDVVFSREYGLMETGAKTGPAEPDSTMDTPDLWQ